MLLMFNFYHHTPAFSRIFYNFPNHKNKLAASKGNLESSKTNGFIKLSWEYSEKYICFFVLFP